MAAKSIAKRAVAPPAPAATPAAPAVDALPDSPLAVESPARVVAPPAVPVLRLVSFHQVLVDGKLGGTPLDLITKRPDLTPAVFELFRAREAKLLAQHTAAAGIPSGSQL